LYASLFSRPGKFFYTQKNIIMKKIILFLLAGSIILLSAHTRHIDNNGDKAILKSFSKPDEVREFAKGKLELVTINGVTIGKATFQPGWKWCEAPHFKYHVSGVLQVKMDDGTVFECKAGDVSMLPSGHDAWVVGNEPAVVVDFHGMVDYGKKK